MPGGKVPFSRNYVLQHFLSGTKYVGLGALGVGTEFPDPAYARQEITFTINGDMAVNDNAVLFPFATQDNGQAEVGIWDSLSGGNRLYFSHPDNGPFTYNTDERIVILAGDLTISEA